MANSTATAQARLLINGKEVVNSFDTIKSRIKETRKEMNGLEQGTAAYARKEKDLVKLETRLSQITKRQTDIRKSAKMVVNQNGELVKSYANLTPFGGMLSRFSQQYDLIKKGINTNVAALGRLKVALLSTGIGAIVIILGSLITYLTTTQEGINRVTAVTRPLKAIFEGLLGVVQNLGKMGFDYLANAIKNPKEALNDLWQFIKDQVIHRFEALGIVARGVAMIFKGDFQEGARTVADGALQMATGVENVIDKLGGAANAAKDFVSESVKIGQEIDDLDKRIRKFDIDNTVYLKKLEAAFFQNQEIAKNEKLTSEERMKAANAAIAAQDELLAKEKEMLALKTRRAFLETQLNDTSDEAQLAYQQLLAQEFEFEQTASRKRATARALTFTIERQTKKQENETLRADRVESENLLNINLAEIRTMELQAIVDHEKLKNETIKKSLQQELDERRANSEEVLELQKQQAKKESADQSRRWELRLKMAKGFSDNFLNILNFIGASENEMNDFQKASTLVQIALDTAAAIASLTKHSEGNPANTFTFGAAGVAQFVAGMVRITANMAQARNLLKSAKNPDTPKFRQGTLVSGPSHEQGGIKLINSLTGQQMGEMEGGEGILTRAINNRPDLQALVNYANMQAGGVPIYKEGGQAPVANAATATTTGAPSSADMQQFTAAVAEFRAIVAMFPTEVYGKWVYQDFKRMENEYNKSRGEGL